MAWFEAERRATLGEVRRVQCDASSLGCHSWPFSQWAATADRCRQLSFTQAILFILDTPDKSTTSFPPKSVTPQPPTHSGAVVDAFQILPKQQSDILSLLAPGTERVPHPWSPRSQSNFARANNDLKWDDTPEQVTSFPEKPWLGKRCDPGRTMTSREPTGSKCTGSSPSHMSGRNPRKAPTRSGRGCCSSTEVRPHSRVRRTYAEKRPLQPLQGVWDDLRSTRWNPDTFCKLGVCYRSSQSDGSESTTFGQGWFFAHHVFVDKV